MQFGFVVTHADAHEFVELAQLGEAHGWDGVFTWEALWGVDAWVTLGAAAMVTEHIRLGTMLTPVARVRPWDLASRVATVDRLSGGRAILSAGLGALHEGWTAFEHDEGRRVRAEKLDECLAIYDGLLRGQPFSFEGMHYSASPTTFFPPPPPIQRPRPPVWVVGAFVEGRSTQPSLDRAARWDGLLPQLLGGEDKKIDRPDELAKVLDAVHARRQALGRDAEPYDVVIEADSTGEFVRLEPDDPSRWEQAGATWWVESWWTLAPGPEGLEELRRRVALGPRR
jgi:alkanesulfonate monooxygenase SsuD/methylene tetrahydromethanopterin reductase-like flavin-dependent oxidoreductase (luciferase family)